jgi:A/G-specific adenine glycosylase
LIRTENNLTLSLIHWFSIEKRDLPWREDHDPYNVWLSEIILQQTRIAQGTPYYNSFISTFPTVFDLANADEQQVLKLWEGLGYYSRARNMHQAARQVVDQYNGQFPNSYASLLKLKGVGYYTAAAIASICFQERVPVIDGNVYRLISRLYGVSQDISIPRTRKVFDKIIREIMPTENPGDFNQALMEFGSLICKPQLPLCAECQIREYCYAQKEGRQKDFPVKGKKIKVTTRHFHYAIITHDGKIGMKKRQKGDIWQGLWDFHLLETADSIEIPSEIRRLGGSTKIPPDVVKHQLTHQRIFAQFYLVKIADEQQFSEIVNKFHLTPYSLDELITLPKPKLIVNYLTQLNI